MGPCVPQSMLLFKMRTTSVLPLKLLMRTGSLFGLPVLIMRYEVVFLRLHLHLHLRLHLLSRPRLRKDATSSLR